MTEVRHQFAGALLLILTTAAILAGFLSFQHLRTYPLHDDGVTWVDRKVNDGQEHVVAAYISPGGPGDKAGIRVGDELVRIGEFPIRKALEVPQALWQIPIMLVQTRYTLRRGGIEFQKDNIFIQAAPRDSAVYYQYAAGVAYLAIGLFVYYRRTSAAKSLHFFLLCLTSFIASCFHYSGKLNTFDEVMYWGNLAASLIAPAIFLHFCLTFHERPKWLQKRGAWVLLYVPSAVLLLLVAAPAENVIRFSTPLLEVRWLLDRLTLGFEMVLYFAGAVALGLDFAHAEDPVLRRQLKYLRNGALVGLAPFALLYALPYVAGVVPTHLMNLSVLSMALIPLTWAYAITRYRLMDVDIIFQQGYVYTLATLAVIGTFYGLIFLIFNTRTISPPAFVVLIAFATFVFQPIRRWIQEQLDRWVFYRDRYDARLTLIEFARELGSETDQNAMLAKVSERLLRTLSLQQIGFFLLEEASGSFQLHSLTQKSGRAAKLNGDALHLRFLEEGAHKPYIFFERPKHLRDIVSQEWPQSVRDTIAALDFTYYVACKSRGRTIAFFGVSRTTEGDFLSSDDVELLVTLSNYVAIAIENSRLYSSLQRKADEYERLKEFSENIVESINVGILAADLDDRVESWNTQIEKLTGIPRDEAIGRQLSELFPAELCQKFDELKGQDGIHNVYKMPLGRRVSQAEASENGQEVNGRAQVNGYGGLSIAKGPAPQPRESVVNLAIAPWVSKELKRIGRLIIFDDITDRDELERRLVQADKLSSIGLLAAGVAHEVNTPLAVISTYAQMLAKQVSGDDQKSKLLEKIAKQTFRASEIINSLLNFSRTSPTDFVEVDLNRVIRETATLIEHQFQKAGIKAHLNLAEDLPIVRGNSGKLQQIFLNLFINARDAMPGGGSLAVRTWAESGFAHVEVADTGQGIPPENLARIFDPFFTTKSARKGTGLGLSITYGIVQEHNGIIEVDSAVGRGTRFRLEFPGAPVRLLRTAERSRQALPA
ncbi:MAG: PAS domain S-box protein [Acidobacteriaceae bacterium]|nr:PAS domain S-box protein [Acidobacteriaceae bacterium]MBV9778359.1 PAS domain S-box protein [Acidobacteriaceae bacterium]